MLRRLLCVSALLVFFGCGSSAPAVSDVETVAAIQALGGLVERDTSLPGQPVVKVDLHASAVTDVDLERIGTLRELRALDLRLTHVGDAGVAHLKGLTALRSINLFRTQLTDAGLEHLAKLPTLEVLLVGKSKVTEEGTKAISKALPTIRFAESIG